MSDRCLAEKHEAKDLADLPQIDAYGPAVDKNADTLPADILDLVSELYWNERPPASPPADG